MRTMIHTRAKALSATMDTPVKKGVWPHTFMCTNVCVYRNIHTRTETHMHTRTHAYMDTYIYTHSHTYCIHLCICRYTTHIHVHICLYIYIRTCIHIHSLLATASTHVIKAEAAFLRNGLTNSGISTATHITTARRSLPAGQGATTHIATARRSLPTPRLTGHKIV